MTDLEKIKYLVRLQELFNRKQEIQNLYRDPEEKLNKLLKDHHSLSSTYEDISMNLEEMQKALSEKEEKLEEINQRISSLEEGKDKIKIARQLKSWEKEMEKMTQERGLLEAQIDYDSSKLEEMQNEAERIRRKLEEQQSKINAYETEIQDVKSKYSEEIKDIESKSEAVKVHFEPQFSDYFETMLIKTKGSAIVTVDKDSCGGCFIVLPTLLQGDLGPNLSPEKIQLHECPHCFRYLYFEEWLEN